MFDITDYKYMYACLFIRMYQKYFHFFTDLYSKAYFMPSSKEYIWYHYIINIIYVCMCVCVCVCVISILNCLIDFNGTAIYLQLHFFASDVILWFWQFWAILLNWTLKLQKMLTEFGKYLAILLKTGLAV